MLSIRCCRGSTYPSADKEGQDKIRGWRDSLPVCSRCTARRQSRWCRAGVCLVYRCAWRTGWAEGAHWTLVCGAVYHRDCTERGQPDDASAQFDLCAAAWCTASSSDLLSVRGSLLLCWCWCWWLVAQFVWHMLQKYLAISAFLYKFSMPSYVCHHCRPRHGLFFRPSYALAHCLVGVDI